MMNNVAHVLNFLDQVPKLCQFDRVLNKMHMHGEEEDIDKSTKTLEHIVDSAKEDVINNLEQIINNVGKRVSSKNMC